MKTSDVKVTSEEDFTAWLRSTNVKLLTGIAHKGQNLPPGSRLKLVRADKETLTCKTPQNDQLQVSAGNVRLTGSVETMQKIEGAILAASKLTGTKYVWGGRTADGIDCSGLTQLAFASQGINLPRDADQQALVGRFVATSWYRDAMERGDLMFFMGRRGTISHVAIYLGEGKFIEAADGGVKVSTLSLDEKNPESRRDRTFAFARRVIE
jgi:cell wall-associated NlpC family hydrolase